MVLALVRGFQYGECCFILDLREGHRTSNFSDTIQGGEFIEEHFLVGKDVFDGNLQEEVLISQYDEALKDIWQLSDARGELIQVGSSVSCQFDVRQNDRLAPNRFGVHNRHPLLDDAVLFQALNAPPASRLRKADFLTQSASGQTGICLKLFKYAPIYTVDNDAHKKCSIVPKSGKMNAKIDPVF
jgi:hypothetical protein